MKWFSVDSENIIIIQKKSNQERLVKEKLADGEHSPEDQRRSSVCGRSWTLG